MSSKKETQNSPTLTTRAETANKKYAFDMSEQGFLKKFRTMLCQNNETFKKLADSGRLSASVLKFGLGTYNGQHHFYDTYPIKDIRTGIYFHGDTPSRCAHLKKAVNTINKSKEFPFLLKFTGKTSFWSSKYCSCDATASWNSSDIEQMNQL